jgi:hypothetical protein
MPTFTYDTYCSHIPKSNDRLYPWRSRKDVLHSRTLKEISHYGSVLRDAAFPASHLSYRRPGKETKTMEFKDLVEKGDVLK